MREQELAELLMRMAADRGVDVEPAAEELASLALPSYVDRRSFRAAVVQSLEAHMRTQMEQRLQSIRQRFDVDAPAATPQVAYAQVNSPAAPVERQQPSGMPARDGVASLPDATVTDLPLISGDQEADTGVEMEDMPADATMVWTTRHG